MYNFQAITASQELLFQYLCIRHSHWINSFQQSVIPRASLLWHLASQRKMLPPMTCHKHHITSIAPLPQPSPPPLLPIYHLIFTIKSSTSSYILTLPTPYPPSYQCQVQLLATATLPTQMKHHFIIIKKQHRTYHHCHQPPVSSLDNIINSYLK